ncbi:hypothetical protein ACFQ08_29345, partial [Streptosporangium algeriense]
METVIRISACYAGRPTRHGPVTMGQANMARCVLRDPPLHMNFRETTSLPRGTTLAAVVEAVGLLLARHESLRATIRAGSQLVSGSGTLPVEVHVVEDEPGQDAVDRLAEEVGLRLQGARFDVENELPIRVAVIAEGDVPLRMVFVLTHTSVDEVGLATVMRDWERLIRGEAVPEPCPTQPLDLALEEKAPPTQLRTTAALRHWGTQLSRVPQSMFAVDEAADPE